MENSAFERIRHKQNNNAPYHFLGADPSLGGLRREPGRDMLLIARKPAHAAHTRRYRVGALCRRGPQRTSRKHKMRQLSFVLALALCGCSSPQAVPDADTAIAIAKTQCGTANNPKTWDATLVGNIWTVHARDLDLQLFSEKTMQVTTDGQITPGCRLIPRPGRNPQP